MKKILSIFAIVLFVNNFYSQEKKASNPIIFLEGFGGVSLISGRGGFSGGFELNYQNKTNLFSFRIIETAGYKKDSTSKAILPSFERVKHNNEYSLLYGKRWLKDNYSFSISAGFSHNHFISNKTERSDNYLGFPFEVNLIRFKSKKYNAIGNIFIPKIGMKLFGNISKQSYVGLGLSIGIGYYKEY